VIERPKVGRLTVPFMVDASRTPVDFKLLDQSHVDACAREGRCGVCGGRIRKGPVAFLGPDDGRTCFADPWMHPACAELALEQCPFLGGSRDWRGADTPDLATTTYRPGQMTLALAWNWRAHLDPILAGHWHFEAVGPVERPTA